MIGEHDLLEVMFFLRPMIFKGELHRGVRCFKGMCLGVGIEGGSVGVWCLRGSCVGGFGVSRGLC